MDEERRAADFAAGVSIAEIPEDVLEHASYVIADSIGAVIGGSTVSYISNSATNRTDADEASILGTAYTTTVECAARVNGAAGTVLELDEGHKYSAGHPAMHVLPAVLAVAEQDGGTGSKLLGAFIAGYEVCARVGMACNPLDPVYHMHGTWGTVGAAAGVANYRGLDPEKTATAMRIAANHALHTRFDTATDGATVRNTYAGMSAMNGVIAVDQAMAGFTGLEDGLARHLDRVCKNDFRRPAVSDSLGQRWEVTRGYFKDHAACRYTHGALDALDAISDREDIRPDAIDAIVVETYPAAARLDGHRPENDLQAKFSIPFAVATRLRHGHSGKEAFAEDAVSDETDDLANRVSVKSADDLARRVPESRGTRVTITLNDGRELTEEILHPKGDEENPLTTDELREKFLRLTTPILDDDGRQLWSNATGIADAHVPELCRTARTS